MVDEDDGKLFFIDFGLRYRIILSGAQRYIIYKILWWGGGVIATWEYKNIKVQGGGEKEKIASKTGKNALKLHLFGFINSKKSYLSLVLRLA